ncbi:hypothetical protein UQW22_07425 [Isoptericola halotolerans]|uniref:hypothetical protein n=1 Tax=Isoptericola halotolerans TaxID=300560 RepID=UPI00388EC894
MITPTIWGYATLTRTPDGTIPSGGATWRVDTVLPPELTPDELEDFHCRLAQHPGRRRHAAVAWAGPTVRRALRGAIDVRTSVALGLHHDGCQEPQVVATALVRVMRSVADTQILPEQEPLARQLAWCALAAARQGETRQVLDATACLQQLSQVDPAGEATG